MRDIRSLPIRRVAALVIPAAILAVAVTVGPSFAGSFLTRDQAAKRYLPRDEARKVYLTHDRARAHYLGRNDARKAYLRQSEASKTYEQRTSAPIAGSASSTAVFGPRQSTTPIDIPGSQITIRMPQGGLAAITFSGDSQCTASGDGVPCQVGILVDGLLASTGKANFDVSNDAAPQSHTVTQTAVLSQGPHTISAQYSGSSDATVNFKLASWNLVVEAFPGQ